MKKPNCLVAGLCSPEGPRWRNNRLWFAGIMVSILNRGLILMMAELLLAMIW